jgi:hypothetical protein
VIDPFGFVLTSIRDDVGVAALTTRIRGGEPAGGDDPDVAIPFRRFVVLTRLGRQRQKRLPMQEVRISARCYGTTYQDASRLADAVSDAMHAKGPRISGGGVGVWVSFEDGGDGSTKDPDTAQPYESVVISVVAATTPIV